MGEAFVDPARHVLQTFGCEPAAVAKASIDRGRVFISKVFDNHVEHD
jgi:hypothetical protein